MIRAAVCGVSTRRFRGADLLANFVRRLPASTGEFIQLACDGLDDLPLKQHVQLLIQLGELAARGKFVQLAVADHDVLTTEIFDARHPAICTCHCKHPLDVQRPKCDFSRTGRSRATGVRRLMEVLFDCCMITLHNWTGDRVQHGRAGLRRRTSVLSMPMTKKPRGHRRARDHNGDQDRRDGVVCDQLEDDDVSEYQRLHVHYATGARCKAVSKGDKRARWAAWPHYRGWYRFPLQQPIHEL